MSNTPIQDDENLNVEPDAEVTTFDEVEKTPGRPMLLTVLCIITYVVSGYFLFTAIVSLFTNKTFDPEQWHNLSEQMVEALSGVDSTSQDMAARIMDAMSDMIRKGVEKSTTLGLVAIATSGLSIYSAYLMFKLKRMGYYLYIFAKALGVFIPLIIFGTNIVTVPIYGVIFAVGLPFIILYGINLKYMR